MAELFLPMGSLTVHRSRLVAADIAHIAVFAAVIAMLGLPGTFAVVGNAVPITLQTAGPMLAGTILGARRGAAACAAFVVLVAAGLPLLAGGRGGLGMLVSPTAGYLLAFIPAAAVIGWLVQRAGRRPPVPILFLACVVGGIGVVYLIGVPVQALVTGVPLDQTIVLSLAFLPGDLIKAGLAAVIAGGTHRAYPQAVPAVWQEERTRAGAG